MRFQLGDILADCRRRQAEPPPRLSETVQFRHMAEDLQSGKAVQHYSPKADNLFLF
jgi:hypothetical protein